MVNLLPFTRSTPLFTAHMTFRTQRGRHQEASKVNAASSFHIHRLLRYTLGPLVKSLANPQICGRECGLPEPKDGEHLGFPEQPPTPSPSGQASP
jgi:hypothetical protein